MNRNSDPAILFLCEYVKDFIYFATVRQGKVLHNTPDAHFFCIDGELVYENFYSDFGPLNIGCVYRYCKLVDGKVKQCYNKRKIVHYTQTDLKKKTNAAFLLGCYGVLYLNYSPRDALKPFLNHGQIYRPFQDAVPGESIYSINLLECFCAIKKAHDLGFFDFRDFDYDEYQRLDQVQGGDISWIVPNKFLAFIGPVDCGGSLYHPPQLYVKYFHESNVRIVMRLNKNFYDRNVFIKAGIEHYDMFFPDGSCPPKHILFKFLQISEESHCAIAVHCKAGLGRTGSLIGCYLIKHYRMTAREAIAWMRICRPGSVIGHQQEWLEKMEPLLIKHGNVYRKHLFRDTEKITIHNYGIYSIAQKSCKQQPSFLRRKISPSFLQKNIQSDMCTDSIIKSQWSRTSDASSTMCKKDMSRPSVKMTSAQSQTNDHCTPSETRSRISGAGEPRTPIRRITGSTGSNDSQSRSTNLSSQVPSFKTSKGPFIKTLNDAKNFLSRISYDNTPKTNKLPVVATRQYSFREKKDDENTQGCSVTVKQSIQNSALAPVTMQQNRRRLGRSPSPLPTMMIDRSRATNTPLVREKLTPRCPSKTTIREELSRLKNAAPRRGSVGAASVGAGSLGANRDAPASKRAPSVRSDEQPTATQGDMLNSIKFQRRYQQIEKIKSTVNEKPSYSMKKEPIKHVNVKTSSGSKQGVKGSLGSREKVDIKSKGLFSRPRSPSPADLKETSRRRRLGIGRSKRTKRIAS